MKTLRFRAAQETHPGLRRRENEDALAVHASGLLFVVADGMGGHMHGRFASDAVTRHLSSLALTGDFDADLRAVRHGIEAANRVVFDRGTFEKATIGTTVVALYANGAHGACLWVGDSRIYRYRDGQIEQLTRDHTQVRHLLDTKQITADEAKHHPMGHVLTRAVGVDATVRIETAEIELAPDDTYLLCSDGLTACASEDDIAAALREAGPNRAGQRLVELCLERGAPDNVSIVIVTCDEVTAAEEVTLA